MSLAAIAISVVVFLYHVGRANTDDEAGCNSLFFTVASAAVAVGCILYMRGAVS